MGDYADAHKDLKQIQFLERWAPEGTYETIPVDQETLRWNIARARAAEHDLTQARQNWRTFIRLMNGNLT